MGRWSLSWGVSRGFRLFPGLLPSMGTLNPVSAHTSTHIHTHLFPQSEHFLRYQEDMPSALAFTGRWAPLALLLLAILSIDLPTLLTARCRLWTHVLLGSELSRPVSPCFWEALSHTPAISPRRPPTASVDCPKLKAALVSGAQAYPAHPTLP